MTIVSVLTSTAEIPSRESMERFAREFLPRESLSWREVTGGLNVNISGAEVSLRPVAGPVPNAEADTSAFLSPASMKGWRLGRHSAHLALALETGGRLASLEHLTRLTKISAAVARATGALGVHWGGGPVTHSLDFFTEIAREAEVPIPAWVGVSITPEEGGRTSLLSFGMAQRKLPEFWLTAPNAEVPDAFDFFFSALATVAERGSAPEDGERIPRSLFSRPKVVYAESPVEPGKRVWKVVL
ncbi:MAG: hypothetical protein JNM17_17385 [Archangium sp.]|nr:hypothetical protein [Archangium sp.]